jgi:hypothetical protein
VARGHDVRDAVRDDAGFAAASACKDENRTFGMAHRLTLLGIEPFEEIHFEETT